jgi:hypothetical protein
LVHRQRQPEFLEANALKFRAQLLLRYLVEANRGVRRTETEAMQDMIQVWEEPTEDVVREGWDFEEWKGK